jgi:two-component sensor histidine kinase
MMSVQTPPLLSGNFAVLAREMLQAFTKHGMAWFGKDARLVECNEAFAQLTGMQVGESCADTWPQLAYNLESTIQQAAWTEDTTEGKIISWQINYVAQVGLFLVSAEDKTAETIREKTQAFISEAEKLFYWEYQLFDGTLRFTQGEPADLGLAVKDLQFEKFLQVLTQNSKFALMQALEKSLLVKTKFELEVEFEAKKAHYKMGGLVHHHNHLPVSITGYLKPLLGKEADAGRLETVLAYKNKPFETFTLLGVDGHVDWKYKPEYGFELAGTMPSDHHGLNGDLPQIVSVLQQNKVHSRPAHDSSAALEQTFYPVFNYKGNLVQIVAIEHKKSNTPTGFQPRQTTLQEQFTLEKMKSQMLENLVKKDFDGFYNQLPTLLLELPQVQSVAVIMVDALHGMLHVLSKAGDDLLPGWDKQTRDWLMVSLDQLESEPIFTHQNQADDSWKKRFVAIGKNGLLLSLASLGKVQYVLELSYTMLSDHAIDMLTSIPHALQAAGDFDTFNHLKEDIRKKEFLLKELNHRAKNNLAVVAGLLKLQSSFTDNEEARAALAESQSRIQSMSKLHEQLYKPAESELEVDMQAYFTELVAGIKDGLAGRQVSISLQCEPVKMHHKKAVTCGLLVNEMVTNSLKHAFHGINDAKIDISLSKKNEMWYLAVADNGTGLTETNTKKLNNSLGMILIHEFVEQLNGKLSMETQHGTTFTITFAND